LNIKLIFPKHLAAVSFKGVYVAERLLPRIDWHV
jgi:hypothetical protein